MSRGFRNTYRGIYTPNIPNKWINKNKIEYLSLWERRVFVFLENHKNVLKIGSETCVIPYICDIDKKHHKYYVDLEVYFSSGKKVLIEIKPDKQQKPPKNNGKKKERQIVEMLQYTKNMSKWRYAWEYAKQHNFDFQLWGEKKLKELKIL